MSGTIKAVGFDLDGTFLKTHVDYSKLNGADLRVLESHGIPWQDIDFGDSPKRPRAPVREWLEVNGRGSEFQAISREIDEAFTAIELEFVDEAAAFPGSRECIPAIKARGLKVGLLTRGSKRYAEAALEVNGLIGAFDVVMGRDYSDYDNAKPSPVAMIEFARELGVSPAEVLYVGDNLTDWMSASGAGAMFVGVLSGSCKESDWRKLDPDMPVIPFAGDVLSLLRSLHLRGDEVLDDVEEALGAARGYGRPGRDAVPAAEPADELRGGLHDPGEVQAAVYQRPVRPG
jgi:phosphoglycolate phosphatase